MAKDQDYEILPHQVINDLKFEVEALKKKLTAPDAKMNELILEIESLKDNIHDLNSIFQKALELSKDEDPSQKLLQLFGKVDMVIRQNETIAKGMVAISDKLDSFMNRGAIPARPMPTMQHSLGMPPMPGTRTAPSLNLDEPKADDLPPPPPKMSKKLGGMF